MLGVAAVTCLAGAVPAQAKNNSPAPASGPIACSLSDLNVTTLDCSGFYSGNLLSNATRDEQFAGLKDVGFTWDKNFTGLEAAGLKYNLTDSKTVGLHQTLTGITFLGIHFGGGGPNGVGNGTGFYKIDAGSSLTSFLVKFQGISNIAIYSTGNVAPPPPPAAVPEPAMWALLISGFGLIGAAARRRKRTAAFA
ncbi:PEPxxWA-CTERM sorting domain-containing protein [Sphingomonas sp. ID1715]|nr:PEPxxWA-CTERM sorting domain-containing protein [Sphingomonas sp. ID1715]